VPYDVISNRGALCDVCRRERDGSFGGSVLALAVVVLVIGLLAGHCDRNSPCREQEDRMDQAQVHRTENPHTRREYRRAVRAYSRCQGENPFA
jgi:hypothetical protein